MTSDILLISVVGAFIAFVNGANDVSKGIATLAGSGLTSYRRAILWGSVWTLAGGMAGSVWAGAMVKTFGTGLLGPGVTPSFVAALAIIMGAALWVLFATLTCLPVSTTHAIVGSLAGVGTMAYGVAGVRWNPLMEKIFLPLLLSPIISLGFTFALAHVGRWRWGMSGESRGKNDCLCAEIDQAPIVYSVGPGTAAPAALLQAGADLSFSTGTMESCAEEHPAALRLGMDHLHWLTSGATSMARGMNDAPKIAALVLAASALASGARDNHLMSFMLVTLGMVAGSLVAGLRVTEVLAERVTPLSHREGFIANLVSSALVVSGAVAGLPMSTTHVSSSAIIGTGIHRGPGDLNLKTVRLMLLAWLVTVPGAAGLGTLVYMASKALIG